MMRIEALRVAEVGCFREPRAVEGLSGGLDVLAGENELGKSTLLRALRALLFESHKTASEKLKEQLVPYGGGAPLIEADLAIGNAVWRVRKRFFEGRSAELRHVGNGTRLRGPDAEARLAELLGSGAGSLRLLWTGQRESLEPARPAPEDAADLRRLISGEVSAIAGGRRADAVLAAVLSELGRLVTPATGRPAAQGPLKQAIEACAGLEATVADLRTALAGAEARLERVAIARRRRTELADPFVRQRLADAHAMAARAVEEARAASSKERLAHSEWQRLEGARGSAAEALARRMKGEQELAALREEARDDAQPMAAAREAVARAERVAQQLSEALAVARKEEQAVRARRAEALRAQELARARSERQDVSERLAKARELDAEAGAIRAALARTPVDGTLVRRIEAEEEAILVLGARLDAASARITVELDPAGEGRVHAGGTTLRNGQSIVATDPLVIEIDGIGRIRLDPGAGGERSDLAADLEARREVLADLLARAGAADLAAARVRLDERRSRESRLLAIAAQVAALLPEGAPAAEERLAALAAACAAAPATESEPADVLEALGAQTEAARETREREAVAAAEALTGARMRLASLVSAEQARGGRLATLEAELSAGEAAERLSERLSSLQAAAGEARRSLDAWREKVPSAEAAEALGARLEAAAAAEARLAREREEVEREIAGLEGALERDSESDLHSRLGEAEGALERARARRLRHERSAAELSLIRSAFDAVRRKELAATAAPVIAAIGPYLGLVLPGARLDLDQAFVPEGIERAGAREPVRRLSDGTREQIAVLARLGFARVLAAAGTPTPLLLDDAFVYSDDERIARAFEALRLAASLHQVIVLTCRTRAFAALGGTRLELAPWNPQCESPARSRP